MNFPCRTPAFLCSLRRSFENFAPMEAIPTAVSLTTYAGESEDFMRTPLEDLVEQIAAGTLRVQIGRSFHLDQIAEAHPGMGGNNTGGKILALPSRRPHRRPAPGPI